MKTVTNDFKEELVKLGREIDFKIFLHSNDKIITENNKFLMTEDNIHLVVEQFEEEEVDEIITSEDIYNISIVNKGNLLSTMMKEFDFETTYDLRVGDVIDCSFGLKVNGEYEYINYGRYMIYSKDFNEDTKTYSYVAYDKMLLTMQIIPNIESLVEYSESQIVWVIERICLAVGLNPSEIDTSLSSPYYNIHNTFYTNTFKDIEMTYRDLLDIICQAVGVSMIVDGNKLKIKPINKTSVDTIDEKYLKDINVSFGEKYGPINSVVISNDDGVSTVVRRDEESIALNGLHEYVIKDNLIISNGNVEENYIDSIFNLLNGTEFYINDFSSVGITYLDWLDTYNVQIGGKTYKCLMLNDEIKINQGLEENVYTEMPEQAETENTTIYKTSGKSNKEVSFTLDKQNAKINGTVKQDNIIASLNLAIENGQGVVELKGNTVTIESDNFTLDEEGNMTCNNADIKGGEINLYAEPDTVKPTFKIINPNNENQYVTMTSAILQAHDSFGNTKAYFNYNSGMLGLISNSGTITLFAGNLIQSQTSISGGTTIMTIDTDSSTITLRDVNSSNQTILEPGKITITDGTNTKIITPTS